MGTCFDDAIHKVFFRFGLIAHKFRGTFLIASIAFAIFAGYGLKWIEEQTTRDPQFVFSPENAPWRYEAAVLSQHWPLDEQSFWPGKSYDYNGYVDVIVAGKRHPEFGRPNILNLLYLDEVAKLNNFILYNLTIPVEHDGKIYDIGYTDLCMSLEWKCFLNDHLTMLMPKSRWGDFRGKIAELASDIITKEVNITYPIGWRGSEPLYFGALVGRPHLSDEEGHFDYASAVRLTYNVREQKIGNVSRAWRKKLAAFLTDKDHPPSELLDIGMFHNESLPEGLQDVADTLAPKFAVTCTMLFTFCILVSIVLINHGNGFIGVDWVRSKPWLAVAGIICPLMAIITAFGLILWTGGLYNAIVNVSPFLVLCIGIDDLFIMSAAWHRTNPSLSPPRRLAETLAEAAVAISITSITDIFTFAIGCITTLPGVRMFCLYTCLQCTFTYIYQLTFFTPIMAYAAEMEDRGKHSWWFVDTIPYSESMSKLKAFFWCGSVSRQAKLAGAKAIEAPQRIPEKVGSGWKCKLNHVMRKFESKLEHHDQGVQVITPEETFVNKLFREVVGPFLLARTTQGLSFVDGLNDYCIFQVASLLIYVLFLVLSVMGCLEIREGLDPKFLVREQFYLSNFYALIEETFWVEGLQMQVVVNNPPNLYDEKERALFAEMVHSFENSYYTMNSNATMLWLNAFEYQLDKDLVEFNVSYPNSTETWYARCREWLLIAGGRRLWDKDMVWGSNREGDPEYTHLKAFRFQVGLRNYRTPADHTASCKLMREIASRFTDMNVTTFHEYYPFADQYLELKPSLIQDFVLGLSTMLIVSLIMIPDWRAAVSIIWAIASINLGVLGFMTFWGVNLDSVSMITVIMCIGFAVDLSAHIAYAYAQASGTSHERAVEALETLGWPVFLGAFSTILGICVLTLVDSYIVQIFFKTVFLVISFSMMHGLLFLPILLVVIIPKDKPRLEKSVHPDVRFVESSGNIETMEEMQMSETSSSSLSTEPKPETGQTDLVQNGPERHKIHRIVHADTKVIEPDDIVIGEMSTVKEEDARKEKGKEEDEDSVRI